MELIWLKTKSLSSNQYDLYILVGCPKTTKSNCWLRNSKFDDHGRILLAHQLQVTNLIKLSEPCIIMASIMGLGHTESSRSRMIIKPKNTHQITLWRCRMTNQRKFFNSPCIVTWLASPTWVYVSTKSSN